MLGVLLDLIPGLSRVVLAMGRRGDLPGVFARINSKSGAPAAAVILVGTVILVLCLLGNVKLTWLFSAFTVLVYYAVTNLAALKLPRERRLCRPAFAWLGLVSCLLLACCVQSEAGWLALAPLQLASAGVVWQNALRKFVCKNLKPRNNYMKPLNSSFLSRTLVLISTFWTANVLPSGIAADAPSPAATSGLTVAELTAEIDKLKSLLPDQSHAMADVAYHMEHAWFAGQALNWPLAAFYADETRSHIGWAVRIKPVRKGPNNAEFSLQPYADAVLNGPLKELKAAIEHRDLPQFNQAYQTTLTTCYACHMASNKPYLKLHIPSASNPRVIDFEADTK